MSDNYTAVKMFDEGVAAYLRGDFKASINLFSIPNLHWPIRVAGPPI
jgi:hypothetical protein